MVDHNSISPSWSLKRRWLCLVIINKKVWFLSHTTCDESLENEITMFEIFDTCSVRFYLIEWIHHKCSRNFSSHSERNYLDIWCAIFNLYHRLQVHETKMPELYKLTFFVTSNRNSLQFLLAAGNMRWDFIKIKRTLEDRMGYILF